MRHGTSTGSNPTVRNSHKFRNMEDQEELSLKYEIFKHLEEVAGWPMWAASTALPAVDQYGNCKWMVIVDLKSSELVYTYYMSGSHHPDQEAGRMSLANPESLTKERLEEWSEECRAGYCKRHNMPRFYNTKTGKTTE